MKQTPIYDRIQQRMKPGVITLEGFLGDDKRALIDIIEADRLTVRNLGVTAEAIASKMEDLKLKALDGMGEFISVDDHFDVRVDTVRGLLPSPFGGKGMYGKVNTMVVNKRLGKSIVFTDLHIHFIKDHCFFEGKGSPYRLEPQDLVEILEVKPTAES